MKILTSNAGKLEIESEGKLLEVIPVLTDAHGAPMTLPPVVWHVPNELLGYENFHYMSMPAQFYMNERVRIPGTNSARGAMLSFLVRILEASPSSGIEPATVDAAAVTALIQAIRESVNRYN